MQIVFFFPCKFRSYFFPFNRTFCRYLQTVPVVILCYSLSSKPQIPFHVLILCKLCVPLGTQKMQPSSPRRDVQTGEPTYVCFAALQHPVPVLILYSSVMPAIFSGNLKHIHDFSVSCSLCRYGEMNLWATAGFWRGCASVSAKANLLQRGEWCSSLWKWWFGVKAEWQHDFFGKGDVLEHC